MAVACPSPVLRTVTEGESTGIPVAATGLGPPGAGHMMSGLVDSGAIAVVAMTIIAAEILIVWFRRAPARAAFAANGLAGIFILAALGFALTGFAPGWIAAALGLSFVAHILYLLASLRR